MEESGRPQSLKDVNGDWEWPDEGHKKDLKDSGSWLHGDFRANALHFVYPMYKEMIIRGGMNDE